MPESFHIRILAFALPTSAVALSTGRRRYGALYPVIVGCSGLTLLAMGAPILLHGHYETPATMAGNLCLAFAHVANWRLRHRRHRHGWLGPGHGEVGAKDL